MPDMTPEETSAYAKSLLGGQQPLPGADSGATLANWASTPPPAPAPGDPGFVGPTGFSAPAQAHASPPPSNGLSPAANAAFAAPVQPPPEAAPPVPDASRAGMQQQSEAAIGAPLHFRKGLGFVDKSRVVQSGVTGEDADVAHSALDQYGQTAQQAIEIGQRKGLADAAAQTAYLDQVAQQQRAMAAEDAKQQAARADEVQYQMDKLQALQAQAQAGQIDPEHMWHSMSTPSKILASIGLALGGFGAGLARTGGNPALTMIQQKIDADIDAQKANLGNLHASATAQRGLLGEMYNAYGNMDAAKAATRTAMLTSAKSDLDAMIAKTSDQAVKQRGLQQSADLAAAIADQRTKAAQIFGTKAATSQAYDAGGWVGAGRGAPAGDPKLFVQTGPNGQGFFAPTEKEAEEGRKQALVLEGGAPIIDEAKKDRAGLLPGELFLGNKLGIKTDAYSRLEADQAALASLTKLQENQRSLSPEIVEASKARYGDLTSSFGNPEAHGEAAKAQARAYIVALQRAAGAQGGQNVITVDQHGNYARGVVGQATLADGRNPIVHQGGKARSARDTAQEHARHLLHVTTPEKKKKPAARVTSEEDEDPEGG